MTESCFLTLSVCPYSKDFLMNQIGKTKKDKEEGEMTLQLNPICSHVQVFLLKTEKQSLPTKEKLENNQLNKVTNEPVFSEASGTKEEFPHFPG